MSLLLLEDWWGLGETTERTESEEESFLRVSVVILRKSTLLNEERRHHDQIPPLLTCHLDLSCLCGLTEAGIKRVCIKQKWNIYITRLASSRDFGGVVSNLSTMILESLHHYINTGYQSQKWKVCNVHLFNRDYQRERGRPQIRFPAVASCSLTQLELQPAHKIHLLKGKRKRKKHKCSFQPLINPTVDICMVATQRNKTFAKDDWQPIKILSLHGELFEQCAQGDHESFSGYCLAKSDRVAWHIVEKKKFRIEGFNLTTMKH